MLLGLTTKCGRLKTISAAARDCLSPAMFDATHLNRPLSVGNVSKIFKFPVSVTVTLKGNIFITKHSLIKTIESIVL